MLPGSQIHTIFSSPWQDINFCSSGEWTWVSKLYPILRFVPLEAPLDSTPLESTPLESTTMRTPGLQEGNDGYISILSSNYKGTTYTSFRVPSLILLYLLCYKTIIAANKIHDTMDGTGFCIILEISFSREAKKVQGTPACRHDHRR